jgi:hypothetical protein
VDTVDPTLIEYTSTRNGRQCDHGLEIAMHVNHNIEDLLNEMQGILGERGYTAGGLMLGLEDGTLPVETTSLGFLYEEYKNEHDQILYFLISKKQTMFEYIKSIILYLFGKITWSY